MGSTTYFLSLHVGPAASLPFPHPYPPPPLHAPPLSLCLPLSLHRRRQGPSQRHGEEQGGPRRGSCGGEGAGTPTAELVVALGGEGNDKRSASSSSSCGLHQRRRATAVASVSSSRPPAAAVVSSSRPPTAAEVSSSSSGSGRGGGATTGGGPDAMRRIPSPAALFGFGVWGAALYFPEPFTGSRCTGKR
ncbi:unnamed protein product [Urochloa humidicola]